MTHRITILALLVGLFAMVGTGCSFNHANVPNAPIEFAASDYELGDKVSQETCNTYILGINFAGLFGSDTATVPSPASALPIPLPGSGAAPEVTEAMYMAVQKMPNATHVVQPRTHVSMSGLTLGSAFPIFGKRCGKVEAHSATVKGPYQYGTGQ
jgi:hypothetical protein